MQTVTTIGLDIAKSVFQVHGVDAEGNVILRRQHQIDHSPAHALLHSFQIATIADLWVETSC